MERPKTAEASPPDHSNAAPSRRERRRSAIRDGPEPVDIHVGARIRLRRTLLGLSQGELGRALGVAFQQVQKYERGANRVSASTLHRMAGILDVPVAFFFDDLPEGLRPSSSTGRDGELARRESLELLRSYYAIPGDVRKEVYHLVKSLGREGGG